MINTNGILMEQPDDLMLSMLINSSKISKKKPVQVYDNPTKVLYDEFNKFILDYINTNSNVLKNQPLTPENPQRKQSQDASP